MSAGTDLMTRVAEQLNAGDFEAWLELYSEDVVFLASDSWPENATVTGRDAVREFWREFSGVWEDVRIRIDRIHDAGDAAVAECAWETRGRASGVEGTLEFVLGIWVEDGLIVRGQFFDELEQGLEAVGLGH